ncbi:hypothetical protein HYV86_03410 [Candidatus Woesearchaeota archaeon]|nr:hypothetical protein [Candidatus Woesearchaeota archaeon]
MKMLMKMLMKMYLFIVFVVLFSLSVFASEELAFSLSQQDTLLSTSGVVGNLFLCGEDEPAVESTLRGVVADLKTFHQYDPNRDCYWQYSALDLTCDEDACFFRLSQPVVTPYRVVVFVPELSHLFISKEVSFSTRGTFRLSLQKEGVANLSSTTSFFEREEWIWFVRLIPLLLVLEIAIAFLFVRLYNLTVRVVRTLFILDIILLVTLWALCSWLYISTGVLWSYVLIAVLLRFFITIETMYFVHKNILQREGVWLLVLLMHVFSGIVGLSLVWLL